MSVPRSRRSTNAAAADSGELTAAQRRAELLDEAQSIARVGSWELDREAGSLLMSPAMSELFGSAAVARATDLTTLFSRVHPEDQADLQTAWADFVAGGVLDVRYRLRLPDGDYRWLEVRGRVRGDRDTSGGDSSGGQHSGGERHTRQDKVRLVGTVADISEHIGSEAELRRAHTELHQALSFQQAVITASPDAIHIYDVAARSISRANRFGPALIGYTPETVTALSGRQLETLLTEEDRSALERAFEQAQRAPDGEVSQLRHRVLHADGSVRWVSRIMTPFQRDADGVVEQLLLVSRDVTDAVLSEQRLEHAALHDELTGLPNRRLVLDRLDHALRRAERSGRVAVLFCDLDGFKRINDSHGHTAGDQVLVVTADRLTAATRSSDTVARIGGDEFVVMAELEAGEDHDSVVAELAARIEHAVIQPIVVGSEEHSVTVSIGISLAGADATPESLLNEADTAMYHVKTHGSNGHALFEVGLRDEAMERHHVERQIRRALVEDTIDVHYQPIVDPVDQRLHSVEALLRLRDDQGRFLDAGEVVSVAERTGLIAALDDRVLNLACEQMARWRRTDEYCDLTLTVNRSAVDITREGFYQRVDTALRRSGLEPSALTLEVTETALLDVARPALDDLRRLHDEGIGIAIDDFGTGYASLRYLATLPITCLKIDRSFTAGLPEDSTCTKLVRATIGLAEDLGIRCVVEGIENREQLTALPDYRELLIQGYLYGRPQPAIAFSGPWRPGAESAN